MGLGPLIPWLPFKRKRVKAVRPIRPRDTIAIRDGWLRRLGFDGASPGTVGTNTNRCEPSRPECYHNALPRYHHSRQPIARYDPSRMAESNGLQPIRLIVILYVVCWMTINTLYPGEIWRTRYHSNAREYLPLPPVGNRHAACCLASCASRTSYPDMLPGYRRAAVAGEQ
jgi:hypothetical protein